MERAAQLLGERRLYTLGHVVEPDRKLSGALRQLSELGEVPVLTDPDATASKFDPAADLPDMVDRVIRHISTKNPDGHRFVPLIGQRDHAVGGTDSPEAFDHALGEAMKLGYLEREALDEAAYRLTMTGWTHLREKTKMERQELQRCADVVLPVLYDQILNGRFSLSDLVDETKLSEAELARVLRYAEKKGWLRTDHTHHGSLPLHVELTPDGEQRALGLTKAQPPTTPAQNVIYILSGNNPRVNIGSRDDSVNVVALDSNTLFDKIVDSVAAEVEDPGVRDELIAAVRALEAATDPPSRAELFGKLLQIGANVITVLQPFLPALTQVLGRT